VLNICKQLYRIEERLKISNFFFNFSFVIPTPGTGRRGCTCFDCNFFYIHHVWCITVIIVVRAYLRICINRRKGFDIIFVYSVRLVVENNLSPKPTHSHHYKISCTAITTPPPLRRPFIFIPLYNSFDRPSCAWFSPPQTCPVETHT